MSSAEVTLRQVFSLPEIGAIDSSPDRWQSFQTTVSKEVKTIKWPAAMPDLAEKICELFDVKLPDLFLMSWKKADALRKLLAESKNAPEATKYLELVEHIIRSEHHPYIEARIRNLPVKKIEFAVKLTFKLKGFVLKIKAGEIEEMLTGRCEVEGKVEYAGLAIAEKKLSPIALPALCRFKPEAMPSISVTRSSDAASHKV
jgi:hypothetical protein